MSPGLSSVLKKIQAANLPMFDRVTLTGPNVRSNGFGETPLHVVAFWGDVDATRVLIQEGGLIDVPGEDGCTPLHEATMQGHLEVVRLLLASGADRNLKSEFGDFSEVAAMSENPEIQELGSQSKRRRTTRRQRSPQ